MQYLEKAELITSICHIKRFFKSGIQIYNSEVLDKAAKKTRRKRTRKRTHGIGKGYVFQANVIKNSKKKYNINNNKKIRIH